MKVSQVMTPHPVTVSPGTAVRTARRLLAAHGITTLPVVDAQGRILGVVGEADLLDSGLKPDIVDHLMRRTTVLVHPETDLTEVSRILGRMRVKSLPVVDDADQVVGMVSRSDILRVLARDDDVLRQEVVDALCAAGLSEWRVAVHNGVADLTAPAGDQSGGLLARSTAAGTLGIDTVRLG